MHFNFFFVTSSLKSIKRFISVPAYCACAALEKEHSSRYFTSYQKDQLMKAFVLNAYPDTASQRSLALQLGLTTEQVKVWFANKRTRDRKRAIIFPNFHLF
ncbi:hypothetical protein HPB48_009364 [Haemaphysalis longicornis]|uniref:Homeobox domain-containing protein n=1 Tax=Haemaphysalis longicornis TaxID=44386 RepID=A0A9J6FD35_HAELO|nr:hypothetical protein HPB48_009364 [Haemaphysalis longicornis]